MKPMSNPRKKRDQNEHKQGSPEIRKEITSRIYTEVKKKKNQIGNIAKKLSQIKFQEKAKDLIPLCPKIFNVENGSKALKKVGIHINKGLHAGKKGVYAGVKFAGSVAGRISQKVKTQAKLRKIRKNIYDGFNQLGTRTYQLNLQGEKNIVADDKIKKIFEKVDEYERKIEQIESESNTSIEKKD